MKLRVFHADDGDCLLLSSADGAHRVLVDGGRSTTFREHTLPTLDRLAADSKALDLVVVSHVDNDHISGILELVRRTIAWIVFDHQSGAGGNPDAKKPAGKRPPEIIDLWHNSWKDRFGRDLGTQVRELVTAVSTAVDLTGFDLGASGTPAKFVRAFDLLALGATEGRELLEMSTGNLHRNRQFSGMAQLESPAIEHRIGAMRLTVIGPMKKHVAAMRKAWQKAFKIPTTGGGPGTAVGELVRDVGGGESFANAVASGGTVALAASHRLLDGLAAAARQLSDADPRSVTAWNRASITILAEEDNDAGNTRSCLLTGDAAADELLDGLEAAGRIVDGHFRCNVLKVQHHGALDNFSGPFADTVIADQYVFCANGAHHNPELEVVTELIRRRLVAKGPFKVWFNSSPSHVEAGQRRVALKRATAAAEKFEQTHPGRVRVGVIGDGKSYIDLKV